MSPLDENFAVVALFIDVLIVALCILLVALSVLAARALRRRIRQRAAVSLSSEVAERNKMESLQCPVPVVAARTGAATKAAPTEEHELMAATS